ncbi:hypothetical protein C478_06646 [Natrinema thermotolerans DSM 11552]|nr:hypothetical protein C478_06646 [Natrinema thermotolerans DSM 11552]
MIAMARDPASDRESDDDWSLPDCPRCGEPVTVSVVTGPDSSTLQPCGCSVPPATFVGFE